jgi:hypothetical protein
MMPTSNFAKSTDIQTLSQSLTCLPLPKKARKANYFNSEKGFKIIRQEKADVVEFWLWDHGFDPASANFVVMDDSDLRRFGERFIQTERLFLEKHLQQATRVLKV